MISLKLDNMPVALPEGTSFELVRENPLFTKSGDYSLDIDIPLGFHENIKIYPEAFRLNGVSAYPTKSMVLYDGAKSILKGTCNFLEVKDKVAKVQILANNSSISSDLNLSQSIRRMDLGTCPYTTIEDKTYCNRGYYGQTKEGRECNVAFPVLLETEDDPLYNNDDASRLIPQPYLLFILDTILSKLGLSVRRNDINYTKYRHLLIIHGYKTNVYAKMLPDWTVEKFITEIEKFFNVAFSFDTINKAVDIVGVEAFYKDEEQIEYISRDDICDMFDVSVEEPVEFQSQYKHVGYNLPSNDTWKFQNFSEEVLELCTVVEGGRWNDTYDSKAFELHYISSQDEYKMHFEPAEGSTQTNYFRYVQQFCDIREDTDVAKTELNIIPANINVLWRVDDQGSYMFCAPTPTFSDVKDKTFSDSIREGLEDQGMDSLSVAFFLGHVCCRTTSGAVEVFRYLPQAISTYWLQYYNVDFCFNKGQGEVAYDEWSREFTLSLRGTYGRHATELNNSVILDTTKLYTIKFKTSDFLDPKKVFIFGNRKFYCKQLKYSVGINGFNKVVEGEFFPAK